MLDDDQLIKGLKKREAKAIKQLLSQYQHYVYTICITILHLKEEAEEATQDTFLKILNAIPDYIKEGKLSTWIYPIAYRTSLDYLKKRKNVKLEPIHEYTEREDDISKPIINDFKVKRILKTLDQLKPNEAGLIRMFYFDQFSIKELALMMNQSESNIKVKLHRARQKIIAKLDLIKCENE